MRILLACLAGVFAVSLAWSAPAHAEPENIHVLARRLSAGDISTLRAALQRPGAQMMTAKDSANDGLWSALAAQGLMREEPLPPEMAAKLQGTGLGLRIYSVTERGQTEIPSLLPQFK